MQKFVAGLLVGLAVGAAGTLVITVVNGATVARALMDQSRIARPGATPAGGAPAAREAQAMNNPENARLTGAASTLQTLRGQIELFKIQHQDHPPAASALTVVLLGRTNPGDVDHATPDGTLGPYVQTFPINPVNGQAGVSPMPAKNVGWVYQVQDQEYTIEAVNKAGDGVLAY